MWFTGKNYYNLAHEKDRNFTFVTVTTIWKPGLKLLYATCLQLELYCVIGDVFDCMIRLKHIKCPLGPSVQLKLSPIAIECNLSINCSIL